MDGVAAAHSALGATDSAVAALEKAVTRPGVARQANLQSMLLCIDNNHLDNASRVFCTVKTSGIDFTTVRFNPQMEKVRGDARFASLFPTAADFARPFDENVRIIHEWPGEAAGDEFGLIARGIDDVDKDGVTDVVVGATGMNGFFIYSGIDERALRKTVGASTVTDPGRAVAGVGDLDHDGYADILASSPSAINRRGANAGRLYVFSGKDGKRLLVLNGEFVGDSFGSTLGVGDGRFFVVGASGGGPDGTGRMFAYNGLNPKPLFPLDADSTGATLGAMLASVVGDVNGDGTPNRYATDFANTSNGPGLGRAYIFSDKTGEKRMAPCCRRLSVAWPAKPWDLTPLVWVTWMATVRRSIC